VKRGLPEDSSACDISGLVGFIIFLLFGIFADIAGVDAGLVDVEALILRLVAVHFIDGTIKIYLYRFITPN
jgi:hypothetical protein